MHNKVVYHTMKAFQSLGFPVLRFNYRGTGLSEGAHDLGQGEQDDVRAALDWLEARYPLPVLLAGFSFGSYVGSRAACGDPRVKGIVLLGPPAHAEGRDYDFSYLSTCTVPKLYISGTRDQYGPVDTVEAVVAQSAQPAELVLIDGADHFFVGRLEEVRQGILRWTGEHFLDTVSS